MKRSVFIALPFGRNSKINRLIKPFFSQVCNDFAKVFGEFEDLLLKWNEFAQTNIPRIMEMINDPTAKTSLRILIDDAEEDVKGKIHIKPSS